MRKLDQIFHQEINDKNKEDSKVDGEYSPEKREKLANQYPNILKKYNVKVT